MKKIALIAVVLMMGAYCGKNTESPSGAPSLKAAVTYMTGQVFREKAGARQRLEVGTMLEPQDIVITENDSTVDIMIQGIGVLKLGADARMEVGSLAAARQGTGNVEVRLHRGELGSFVNREDSASTYTVVTPTAIAGVRGTSFLTSVERVGQGQTPEVKVAVLSGSVAVNLPGQEEIIVTRNSQIVVERNQRITRDMIRPLSSESLERIKDLAVFHRSNVLEFNSLVDEIRNNTPELESLQGSVEESATNGEAVERRAAEPVQRAARTDVSRHVQRDTQSDPLKLEPRSGYNR